MTTTTNAELDTRELRLTAIERRRRLDDIAANALGAAADEIDRLRAELVNKPRAITTAAELDVLPVGAVIRGLGPYGGLWQVTDDEELKRYASAGDDSFHMGETLLTQGGPLELLWSPEW